MQNFGLPDELKILFWEAQELRFNSEDEFLLLIFSKTDKSSKASEA